MKRKIEINIDKNEMVTATFSLNDDVIKIHDVVDIHNKSLGKLTVSQIEFIKSEINYILVLEKSMEKEGK